MNDVKRFRNLLTTTNSKIEELCEKWECKLKSFATSNDDDVSGRIRSVVGQGRLVSNSKGRLTQFQTLIDDCEFHRGQKRTTISDLQGFWEMIDLQVQDVYKKFDDLSRSESEGWKSYEKKEDNNNHSTRTTKLNHTLPIMKRKVQRHGLKEMIAVKRKEMKLQQQQTNIPIILTTSPNNSTPSPDEVNKTFEGGFFNVTSPIRPDCCNLSKNCSSPGQRFLVEKSDSVLRKAVLTDSKKLPRSPYAVMRVSSAVKRNSPNVKQKLFVDDDKEN